MSDVVKAPQARFIPLEDIVINAMNDLGETNTALYPRFMAWATRGLKELGYDVSANLIDTFIPIDPATFLGLLPDDYVQHTRVGLITMNNEFVPLAFNPSLTWNISKPDCNLATEHCGCGCANEVCQNLQNPSSVNSEITDVTIAGNTYQQIVSVFVKSNGQVVKRTCVPTVTNVGIFYDYSISVEPNNYPLRRASFTVNNNQIFIGDIEDAGMLINLFQANNFTGAIPSFTISQTNDLWNSFTYTDSDNETYVIDFVQSSPTQQTPNVESVCYEEQLCTATIKACGCVEVNDTLIDVLCTNQLRFWTQLISRWKYNKDFGQALKQPLNYFGEYNINYQQGLLRVNNLYQWDDVYMQYYSATQVDSKNYPVITLAEEALTAYIVHKYKWGKNNVSNIDKMMYKKDWYTKKGECKARLNPIRLPEILEIMRLHVRS